MSDKRMSIIKAIAALPMSARFDKWRETFPPLLGESRESFAERAFTWSAMVATHGMIDAWQPIATAPRDGRNILIRFGQDGASQAMYVPGVPHPWKFIDTNDGVTWLINSARDGEYGPSHWMQMPTADAAPESISIQEVWEAAGGNPGIKATRGELLTALKQLDEVCDEADESSAGVRLSDTPVATAALPHFPTVLRKMWSGGDVQRWIDENIKPLIVEWASSLDAERYRWATELSDNAETVYSVVLCNEGNQEKINQRIDSYRAAIAPKENKS